MTEHTFLVEIGTEELPPKILRSLAEAFANQIRNELNAANIHYGEISWFATPRRLAVKVLELNSTQNDNNVKRRGPAITRAFDADGNPTKAANNWARNCGIKINQAEHLITSKGEWLFHSTLVKGHHVKSLLCNIVNDALSRLPIPKMMRWGNSDNQFIRPVHTVTMMLDNNIIPGKVLGINTDRILYGHRFMGEKEIILKNSDQYPQVLLVRGHVIADYLQRKEKIRKDIQATAKQLGGIADISNSLLEEVTSLVEWPVVLAANFEKKFLSIPSEVLVHSMKENQKYFPIYDTFGNLMPHFIFVANIESQDPQQIIAGNEKVIRSRLADAEFFFKNDRKKKLEDYLLCLNKVLFQKHLGSMFDKSNRISTLASWIADKIGADKILSARAGLLSKCDLMTDMVFEFHDIKGIIGMHYARYDGEPEEVAIAQKEHYFPQFSGDVLPTTLVSCAVAIADKIDTLVGTFGIGQYPKGDKDPFALRRTTIGILRIIVEKQLPLDLKLLIQEAINLYNDRLTNLMVSEDVINFTFSRFRIWYQNKGYSLDTIQAVLACRPTRPVDFDSRICAITYFRTLEGNKALTLANKRISKILTKGNHQVYKRLQVSLLKEQAEITLATQVMVLREKLKPMFNDRRYQEILVELLSLHKPIDLFFNKVLVMSDNKQLRINRLTLLSQIRELFLQVADISLLQ